MPGRLGIPATIVMPVTTPFNKVKHTRDFGATVIQDGQRSDRGQCRGARASPTTQGLTFIHPYDDRQSDRRPGHAGAGDAGRRAATGRADRAGGRRRPDLRRAPSRPKAIKPESSKSSARRAELYPAMRRGDERRCRSPQAPPAQTIAEGIAVKQPGALTTAIVRALVTDILLVGEDAIEHALAMILEIEKTVVEGAAAAGFAAVLANPELFKGRKVGIVMSGGNIDMRLLSNVILRELAREGRILTLDAGDRGPARRAGAVAALVGDAGGNILEVSHNRMMSGHSAKSATLGW